MAVVTGVTGTAGTAGEPAEVVVALGANLGDREQTMLRAVTMLSSAPGVSVRAKSMTVETAPVGGPEQPDYLNQVVVVESSLAPAELLALCHRIEQELGRERQERWGARTVDLDLIAYGRPGSTSEVVSDDPEITLPHPRAHERAFVLVPWLQVSPDAELRLPSGEVRRVDQLLADAPDLAGVRPAPRGGAT